MESAGAGEGRATAPWSFGARVAFRVAFVFGAVLLFPFPLGWLPKTEWLWELLMRPLEWEVSWVATAVLGLDEPSTARTGSGDTTWAYVFHLVALGHALAGAALWTYLDRRRRDYRRLAAAAIVVLRYYLAVVLLSYAVAKLTQFPAPNAARLDERVGEMSPMGMMWAFMGASLPYALFGGFAEALGGALLLWRRTAVAGALVAVATMTNIVMLNLCYDVPVKLFSSQLLACGVLILLPHARRLIAAVLGRATAEVPPRPRRSPRLERARLAGKALLLAAIAVQLARDLDEARTFMRPPHELAGVWVVDRFERDGVEQPPLITDDLRWHKVMFTPYSALVRTATGPRSQFRAAVDPFARRVHVTTQGGPLAWAYALTEADGRAALILEGPIPGAGGTRFRAELTREPPPLLETRGFHWIQEFPYNR